MTATKKAAVKDADIISAIDAVLALFTEQRDGDAATIGALQKAREFATTRPARLKRIEKRKAEIEARDAEERAFFDNLPKELGKLNRRQLIDLCKANHIEQGGTVEVLRQRIADWAAENAANGRGKGNNGLRSRLKI